MKLVLASDHAGWTMKRELKEFLKKEGYICEDYGTDSAEPVDYPDFGFRAAEAVAKGKFERGILICGAGIGMSLAANKVVGVRAALCSEPLTAALSRSHNDTNILVLAARMIGSEMAKEVVRVWLNTGFSGEERHRRRLKKIKKIEDKYGEREK